MTNLGGKPWALMRSTDAEKVITFWAYHTSSVKRPKSSQHLFRNSRFMQRDGRLDPHRYVR
jgi:hypothetical protein